MTLMREVQYECKIDSQACGSTRSAYRHTSGQAAGNSSPRSRANLSGGAVPQQSSFRKLVKIAHLKNLRAALEAQWSESQPDIWMHRKLSSLLVPTYG
jgi:hypothetical protein